MYLVEGAKKFYHYKKKALEFEVIPGVTSPIAVLIMQEFL